MVPTGSILVMILNLILGFAVPILLACRMVRKYGAKWSTILLGAATFFVFALVLEAIVHRIVLKGSLGDAIQGNTWHMALYGGLMAGLFEETGRFLAMKYLLKKEPSETKPAVSYGLGHGGIEVILLFAFSMISLLTMSVMINLGMTDMLLDKTPEASQAALTAQFDQLKNASAGTYLYGLWERLSALTLHVALSVLVWVAVRKGGKWLWFFPAAILLHALVDGLAVILSKAVGYFAIESIVMAMAIAVAGLAWIVARKAFPKVAEE